MDIGDWFERNNPFMYKNEKNEVMCFNNYKDVYKQTLVYMKEDFPLGFFDYALFLKDRCGMDDDCCMDFWEYAVKRLPLFRLNKVIMVDMNNLRAEMGTLTSIFEALHFITETKFSHEALDWAVEEYLKEQEG